MAMKIEVQVKVKVKGSMRESKCLNLSLSL